MDNTNIENYYNPWGYAKKFGLKYEDLKANFTEQPKYLTKQPYTFPTIK